MRRAPFVVAILIAAAMFGSGVRTLAPAIAQIDTGTRPVERLAGGRGSHPDHDGPGQHDLRLA